VPENLDESLETTGRFKRRGPSKSVASREEIFGIDALERKIGFGAAAVALVAGLAYIPHLLKNTYITDTAKYVKGKSCPSGYHLVTSTCEKAQLTHPSYWLPQFFLIIVMSIAIFAFTFRKTRVGIIFASLFLGLASGTIGFVFLLFAAWLGIRAWRLHKYGDASFSGSGKRAKQMAQERKVARASGVKVPRGSAPVKTVPRPEASKRYTPKKPVRKKR
jgi:hypothetical protein